MRYTNPMQVRQTDRFRHWLEALRDVNGRARVLARIDRLAHGNPGDHRVLTGGVVELRVDFGPGYRVYYSLRGSELILLLAGGDKKSQQKDIAAALQLNRDFEA